jgi:8-oxo-dGTP pyrophosphatase MutT (NUDIX family)
MRTIIYDNGIKTEDITSIVTRVKVMLINDKNQVVMAYNDKMWQFPGGHVENNEELSLTLIREIKEETGVELPELDYRPFLRLIHYTKDYPSVGENRATEIYYFEIKNNFEFNLENVNYTEEEKNGNFTLYHIDLEDLAQTLIENQFNHSKNSIITKEILTALKVYNEMKREYEK